MALSTNNYSLDNENFHSFQITQLKDFMIGGKFQNKYKIVEKLGEDDQGIEYKIASNENSEIKVRGLKKLKFKTLNEETLETLRHLKNPFMIEYIDFFKEKFSYFIVYELLQETQLLSQIIDEYLTNQKSLMQEKQEKIYAWSLQILKGLEFLHAQSPPIIHHDIRPSNIHIQHGTIKLGNLKLLFYGNGRLAYSRNPERVNYMSPELIKLEKYDSSIDIWSFGCVLYELITLHKLFNGENSTIISGDIINCRKKLPSSGGFLNRILFHALNRDRLKRANAASLIKKLKTFIMEKEEHQPLTKRKFKAYDLRTNIKLDESEYLSNNSFVSSSNKSSSFVSASADKKIKIWDIQVKNDISERINLEGHDDIVSCLKLLKNGLIASGSWDKSIKIWKLEIMEQLKVLQGHKYHVLCLEESDQGLVSGSADRTIKIWNIDKELCIKTLTGHKDWIKCLKVLEPRIENKLASASLDKTIRIWDIKKGIELKTLVGHTHYVRCLEQFKTSRINVLLTGSADNTIKIWDLIEGTCLKTLYRHSNWINSILRINNREIVTCSNDNLIKVWDVLKGIEIKTLNNEGLFRVACIALVSSNRLLSATNDKKINVWDLNSGKFIKSFVSHRDSINSIIEFG